MVLLLSAGGDDAGLMAEAATAGCPLRAECPGLLTWPEWPSARPTLALARQYLFQAEAVTAESIGAWARRLAEVAATLHDGDPWHLHIGPHFGVVREERIGARAWHTATRRGETSRLVDPVGTVAARAGIQRCGFIRQALVEHLRAKRRHLLRRLREAPAAFTPADTLVQLLLTSPDTGWLAVSRSPEPFDRRQWISPFPKGEVPVAADLAAPSRAFAKLVEAELRFGRRIAPGETCVDLGASPGGWTWVARQRGARVIAVDRSPLREDLMADPAVTFVRGDAFSYQPDRPVDWLVCDVIAAPERSIELVLEWARRRWARHFVVTIKLREGDHPKLDRLKQEMPSLADDWYLTHLCANKHEACVFGSVRPEDNAIAVAGSATA